MTRVLRSAIKKSQIKEDLSSKLSVCQKSKTIKREKKPVQIKNENDQQNYIWNINSVLSNVFEYTDFKDLVNFNTVCKRWNQVTNPIIHRSLKLLRSWDIVTNTHDKRFHRAAKNDAEVGECISNNAKFAPLVKEFSLSEKLEPQRAIEFFVTFRYITHLTISNADISQDQFLCMIKPLAQIQELCIKNLRINRIIYKRLYSDKIQLPSSLQKLTLECISLVNNPELFIQTINSHSNLIEFNYISLNNEDILKPFLKSYPTLKALEYNNQQLNNARSLFKVFESNPQLISLKLGLKCYDSTMISHISSNLINLEEFDITDLPDYYRDSSYIFVKFSQPTKIKKLKIILDKLSSCSINSILQNCPHLEEFSLSPFRDFIKVDPPLSLNFVNHTKIKRLNITCDNLSESSFDNIMLNCSNLKELEVQLSNEWTRWIKIIGTRCINLEKLTIGLSTSLFGQDREAFYKELYETEFLTNDFKFMATLTHLTLKYFSFNNSKAQYFKNFPKLKYIKFPYQYSRDLNIINESDELKDLWPNFELRKHKISEYHSDIEMVKSIF